MSSYFSRLGTVAPVAALYDRRSRASNDYVYDALNRLQRTYMTGHYSQTYNYDRYGNMACAPGSNYCNTTITFDPATNRINSSGYTYDAAGKLTQDGTGYGTHTFQWDAEGRLKSVDAGATASFVYNALGQRVEKQVGSAYTETLYDAFGNVSGYHNRTAWVQDFIPLGSRIFAKYQDGVTYYLHGNPLGSTQVVMRADNTYAQAQNFFSFGGLRWSGGGTADVRFAGMQERDLETTSWQDPLDPTPFRVYTSGLGRWLSADPLGGDITNPQSLNRYAYVLDNPTNLIDPLGLQCYDPSTGAWLPCPDITWVEVTGIVDRSPVFGNAGRRFAPLLDQTAPGVGTDFTLGIRAPNQTFRQCMEQNANTYSLGGAFELAFNVATGTNTSISSSLIASVTVGNSINTFLFGSTAQAAGSMATNTPNLVSTAMGSPLSWGRRTTDILSFNLAGKGGVPLALGEPAAGVKATLGKVGNVLNLGMDFTTKLGVDAAFTAAEAIGCSMPRGW